MKIKNKNALKELPFQQDKYKMLRAALGLSGSLNSPIIPLQIIINGKYQYYKVYYTLFTCKMFSFKKPNNYIKKYCQKAIVLYSPSCEMSLYWILRLGEIINQGGDLLESKYKNAFYSL